MRKVIHAEVYFKPEIKNRILELMKAQCSAIHSAFQAIHKYEQTGNAVKKYVKINYMKYLNQRYISDACVLASGIDSEYALFGGKKAWKELQTGNITKEQWIQKRNNQLYSQGDTTKNGNPNIRVKENKIFVNDPSVRGKWLEGSVFIPPKFKDWNSTCYDARLIYKKNKFKIVISYKIQTPELIITSKVNGAIGIDMNPDRLAVSETNKDGNLLNHYSTKLQRIQFAQKEKREYDIQVAAKAIVKEALNKGKPIIIEKLNFNKNNKSKGNKKFKRMKHNFLHKQLTEAIKVQAIKHGVLVEEVNPAFTSIIGKLKYQGMFSLSSHDSAALVIARRGMGFRERQTFNISEDTKKSGYWNLEGRRYSKSIGTKALDYLKECFLKPPLTAVDLVPL
ncbi:MAG TPA: IS200/IS605 family accessory protein TnpB-related protein [Methanofastidiosum sp.]|nr:IS200/IS605 family accessory protein TnpB-related protein [Methanofastidiosum sp.]